MAKRQVRVELSGLSHLATPDEWVQIVMKTGSVHLAQIMNTESTHIKIKNTKGHTLLLPLAQIDEVWADEKAS